LLTDIETRKTVTKTPQHKTKQEEKLSEKNPRGQTTQINIG